MADLVKISLGIWNEFTQAVTAIITEALKQLASENFQCGFADMQENDLNRELFHRICRITHRNKVALHAQSPKPVVERQHCWDMIPSFEMNSMPSPDDPERAPREDKRPDFQWRFQDDQEADPRRAMRTFVVECKRLRHPSGTWIFNENYVLHGVVRFVAPGHLYGKDDLAGAMIGYVQDMNTADILREINTVLDVIALSRILLLDTTNTSEQIHAASHNLEQNPIILAHTLRR